MSGHCSICGWDVCMCDEMAELCCVDCGKEGPLMLIRCLSCTNNHDKLFKEMLELLKDLSSRLTGDPDAFVEAALKAMALTAKIDKEKETSNV